MKITDTVVMSIAFQLVKVGITYAVDGTLEAGPHLKWLGKKGKAHYLLPPGCRSGSTVGDAHPGDDEARLVPTLWLLSTECSRAVVLAARRAATTSSIS